MNSIKNLVISTLLTIFLFACSSVNDINITNQALSKDHMVTAAKVKSLEYEKYTLDNGLDVILHVDKSDPVVAIDLTAHVGSGREISGRTGFAHLFEHLLFLDSENLGYGGLDEMNTRIGGEGTNGYTSNDVTKYFQAAPKDALEKIVWAEADKIGYFIKTVTENVLAKEKQVVKNEKRQRVDNVPYGHGFGLISKTLYPEDHPYNWPVIGSLADLDAATLKDVKDFYKRWYVPNNVTVTLAGDFEIAEAKSLINKYFGEIPRGADVTKMQQRASDLKETKSLYYEDNFAKVPRLTLAWPSAEQFHPDSYALEILLSYLATGKRAPLNEVLIDEEKLTSSIGVFQNDSEIAGETYLLINAKEGASLNDLMPSLNKAFQRFEENGIRQKDLKKIIAGQEVEFYNAMQSSLGKAIQMGEYNAFSGDPGFGASEIKSIQAVTTEDVMRVYNKYIKDKPYVVLSIVPKGSTNLILDGAQKADVIEEAIVQGAEEVIADEVDKRDFEPTASSFDRSIEPPFGAAYKVTSPQIWRDEFDNGLKVFGIENNETPLVYFSLNLDTGRKRGSIDKPAVASLTAQMLEKGTKTKTTAELQDAIESLGSSISIDSGRTQTVISGSTITRNFDETIALAKEMLLMPRWDSEEFDLLITKTIDDIESSEGDPRYFYNREWPKLLYPDDHIYSFTNTGPKELLNAVTLDDIKTFYTTTYTPHGATLQVVGDVGATRVKNSLAGLINEWRRPAAKDISLPLAKKPLKAQVYFYDVPGAKQSFVRVGTPSISPLDADYPAATAMNYLLGSIYTSRLNTELRVNKGYTYGVRSGFSGLKDRGVFSVRTSVRSNVTLESSELIRDIVGNYGATFTEDDLSIMKSALIKGQALTSETLSSKLSMLNEIAYYGYPDDYRARNAEIIEKMTVAQVQGLASKYLRTDAMYYLIVGDAETQLSRLKELGFGAPVLLNP